MGFVLCRRGYISLRIDRILQGLPRNVSTCCDWKGTAARIVIRIVCDVSVLFGANGGESTDTKERKKLSSFLGGSSSLGVIGKAYPLRSVF